MTKEGNMEGILIGTAVLWILSAVLVVPLTNYSVSRRMAAEGVTATMLDQLPEDRKIHFKKAAISYYVLWDVVVLGIAGFIGGLLGFWFIGMSFEAKGWPGMIAFIASSFLGLSTRGAAA